MDTTVTGIDERQIEWQKPEHAELLVPGVTIPAKPADFKIHTINAIEHAHEKKPGITDKMGKADWDDILKLPPAEIKAMVDIYREHIHTQYIGKGTPTNTLAMKML